MRIMTNAAIAGTICLAFGAGAIASDLSMAQFARAQADYFVAIQGCQNKNVLATKSCEMKAEDALASANGGVTETRKKSTAYRSAKAKIAIARDCARMQLANARKGEAADKPH